MGAVKSFPLFAMTSRFQVTFNTAVVAHGREGSALEGETMLFVMVVNSASILDSAKGGQM